MSLKSREAGKLAMAGLAAAAAFGTAASGAQAATLTQNYQCKIPLVGAQPIKVDIDAGLPEAWPTGVPTGDIPIDATATAGGSIAKALKLIGATSIEGRVRADASLKGSTTLPLNIPLVIQTVTKSGASFADPLVLKVNGSGPDLYSDSAETKDVTVDKIALNLVARNAAGQAIPLKPVATDLDGKAFTQTDNDPGTFDAPCKLVAGQPTKLGVIQYKDDVSLPTDTSAPSKPTNVRATSTASTVNLAWNASTDNVGVAMYEVKRDGASVAFVRGTTAAVSAPAGSSGSYTVVARDRAGNATSSDAVSVSTPGGGVDLDALAIYNADLTGTAQMRTLVQGPLPLKGGIAAALRTVDATYEADLTLNTTTGRLSALGLLPVTAKVAFVSAAKTTGDISDDGVLTAVATLRIKILEVKLFGAIPLAGGNSCQARQLSRITLKSAKNFDPVVGGEITGTFALSDLNGCGLLNGIVSPLTAGGGNTIRATLKPVI